MQQGSLSGAKPWGDQAMLFEVGTQYYVSTSGNDSNDGLSRVSAFATVGKAYSAGVMSAGDGVLILPGEYDQGSGTLIAPPFTLTQGCGIDVTVIKGAGTSSRPVLRPSSGCRFVDLTVTNTQTVSSFAFGAGTSDTGSIVGVLCQRCKFTGGQYSILIFDAANYRSMRLEDWNL